MKKQTFYIRNIGCDDETEFYLDLNEKELEIILNFINENNTKRINTCQPIITISLFLKEDNVENMEVSYEERYKIYH